MRNDKNATDLLRFLWTAKEENAKRKMLCQRMAEIETLRRRFGNDERIADALNTVAASLAEQITRCETAINDVERFIESVDGGKFGIYRVILRERFLSGNSWRKTMANLQLNGYDYAERTVYDAYRNAIDAAAVRYSQRRKQNKKRRR